MVHKELYPSIFLPSVIVACCDGQAVQQLRSPFLGKPLLPVVKTVWYNLSSPISEKRHNAHSSITGKVLPSAKEAQWCQSHIPIAKRARCR